MLGREGRTAGVSLIGRLAPRAAGSQQRALGTAERELQGGGDVLGKVGFDRQRIAGGPVVCLRPPHQAGAAVDQLGADPNRVHAAPDAADDDIGDAQPRRSDRGRGAAHQLGRRSRGDAQADDTGERAAQLLGDAVGEIGLARVAAEVGEGQYGDTARCGVARRAAQQAPRRRTGDGGPDQTAGDDEPAVDAVATGRGRRWRAGRSAGKRFGDADLRRGGLDRRDLADQAIADARHGRDAEGVMLLGKAAQADDDPVDRVVADDAAVPAAGDQLVPADDPPAGAGQRDKHLHHPRLEGLARSRGVRHLPQRRLDRQRADAEGGRPCQVDLYGVIHAEPRDRYPRGNRGPRRHVAP